MVVTAFDVALVFVAFSLARVCVVGVFHMNEKNFPHCWWKQSVKSSVPVVPLSFFIKSSQNVVEKASFYFVSRNIFSFTLTTFISFRLKF